VNVTIARRGIVVARASRTIDSKSPLIIKLSPRTRHGVYTFTVTYTAGGITRTSRTTLRIS
jgi:hypothetical protein